MTTSNADFNLDSSNFNVNALSTNVFGGVLGFDLQSFNQVSNTDLGIFESTKISQTLTSLAEALNNTNKVAAYLGGVSNRLTSQEELLKSQIINYNSAISRIEDADVAKEQLQLVKISILTISIYNIINTGESKSKFIFTVDQRIILSTKKWNFKNGFCIFYFR